MLELRDIHFRYATGNVLQGLSIEVGEGEIVALLGPNGAGKSTLLGLAQGALIPQQGDAFFEGKPVRSYSRRDLARQMALVGQAGELRFPLTALEYVLTGRFAHATLGPVAGFDSPRDIEIAMQAMEKTDTARFSTRPFNHLSSGERQRVALARALAQQPRLLLLDEPTANADIAHQISLLRLLKELARDHRISTLFVTHEINLAAEFADRIALLKDHTLLGFGTPADVLTGPLLTQVYETPLVVDANPLSGNPRVTPRI